MRHGCRPRNDSGSQTRSTTLLHALTDRRVLTLSVCYFGVEIGLYGVILWIPQIFANVGFEPQWIGLAVAIPYGLSAIAMVSWARRSDQTGERVRHIAIASLVGFLGLTASGFLRGRNARHPADLLDPAGADPARRRRGGSHRAHQCHRQPRRIRRPVRDRLAQDRDRELYVGSRGDGERRTGDGNHRASPG